MQVMNEQLRVTGKELTEMQKQIADAPQLGNGSRDKPGSARVKEQRGSTQAKQSTPRSGFTVFKQNEGQQKSLCTEDSVRKTE